MRRSDIVFAALMLVSLNGFSQTVKQNIEKLSRDPKTAENAAKADVYIMSREKVISDTSASIQPATDSSYKSRGSRRAQRKKNK